MRVLLSGTSNSILSGGISHGISSHAAVSQFKNKSFGASGVVAIGDHLRSINFSDFDVCVLDYHVNEAVLLTMGLSSLSQSVSDLLAICDAASKAGCMPVIAIFPLSNRFSSLRPFETATMDILAPFGVPIFNLYPIVERMASEIGCAISQFFMDPNHVSRNIGWFLGAGIIDVIADRLGGCTKDIDTSLSYHSLGFAHFCDFQVDGTSTVVQRSTRLLSTDLLRIEPGTSISLLTLYEHKVIAGMSFNAARSWGVWRDSISGYKIFEPMSPNLFTMKRDLTLVATPFIPCLSLAANDAQLDYESACIDGDDRPPAGFEISGLILRDMSASNFLSLRVPVNPPSIWDIPENRYSQVVDVMKVELAQSEFG